MKDPADFLELHLTLHSLDLHDCFKVTSSELEERLSNIHGTGLFARHDIMKGTIIYHTNKYKGFNWTDEDNPIAHISPLWVYDRDGEPRWLCYVFREWVRSGTEILIDRVTDGIRTRKNN